MTSLPKRKSYEDCKTELNKIKEILSQIDLIKRDPRFFIYEHFSVLKNKVDLRREILASEGNPGYDLDKRYFSVIEAVEEAEKSCEENLSNAEVAAKSLVDEETTLKQRFEMLLESFDRLNSDSDIEERYNKVASVTFLSRIFKRLNGLDKEGDNAKTLESSLNLINDFFISALSLTTELKKLLTAYMDKVFICKIYEFQYTDLNKDFGQFINISKQDLCDASLILTDKLRADLISLCGFKPYQKWILLYRASQHGFNGYAFHSRCNSIEKTITIIETTSNCIFGGYTDKAWTAEKQYIWDNNAFIFSLVSDMHEPIKIKCIDPEHAIYSRPDRGPIFGCGQLMKGHDICVKDNSNIYFPTSLNRTSYTSLGNSYIHSNYPEGARSLESQRFLAGTRQFMTKEIEVYCLLS